jgi:hypothetical protein
MKKRIGIIHRTPRRPIGSCRMPSCSSKSGFASRSIARELPGYQGERIACAVCDEGINFERWAPMDEN